MIKKNIIY